MFFVKKVENEGFFSLKKSGKWGVFSKKVDLSSTQGALCTVSVDDDFIGMAANRLD